MTQKKSKSIIYLKRLGKVVLGFVLFFFILVLVIRTPWAQNFIVGKITSYASGKTDTKIEVGRAFITFSGDLLLEEVYVEDQRGDTLLYSRTLQADIPIYPIAFNNALSIEYLSADGLTAHISRGGDPDTFNFSFLVAAFSSPSEPTANTSEPMAISLGEFNFTDWDFTYLDEYMGTEVTLNLGALVLDVSAFDLEKMKFKAGDFTLEDTRCSYVQTHPFPESEDTTSTTLPFVEVEDFSMMDVDIAYTSKPDGLDTRFNIGTVHLTEILADVSENRYETNDLILNGSKIALALSDAKNEVPGNEAETPFIWPEFVLGVKNLAVEQNSFTYSLNNTAQSPELLDPNAFEIQRLRMKASDFEYRPKTFQVTVSDFSLYETSGIRLEKLAFQAALNDTSASISGLSLQFNESSASATMNVEFASFEQALEHPQNSSLSAAISNLVLHMEDVRQFTPALRQNVYIDSLVEQPITGSLSATGNLKKVTDFKGDLRWGTMTELTARGTLGNVTVPDSLTYDLNNITLNTTKKDISKFISSQQLGISIPETLMVSGTLSGGTTYLKPNMRVTIPEGVASIDAKLDFGNDLSFMGALSVDSLQLGTLLQNEALGTLSLNLEGSGSGSERSTLNAKLDGAITTFEYGGYTYTDLDLSGNIASGRGSLTANISDPNLNMKAEANLVLADTANDIGLTMDIIGADLQKLGFTKNNIKVAANINASYKGSPSNFTIESDILEGIAVADNEQYQLSPIHLKAHIDDAITDLSIKGGFIDGALSSNASPERIIEALKKQVEHYFTVDPKAFSAEDAVIAELRLAIEPTPILSKVFLNGIQDLDSVNISARFDAKKQFLSAEVHVPKLTYAGSSVDSLNAYLRGDSLDLRFSAGIADLVYDPLHLKETYLEGNLKNRELLMDFNSKNDTVQVMHIASELVFEKDTLKLHIDPKDLILNKKQWDIPEDNAITLAEAYTEFQNLILSRNAQKMEISNSLPNVEAEHIGILFENFQLQTFLSLLNPDEALAKGKVEGDFIILNPYDASGLLADIQINDFEVLQNPLGVLTLNASSRTLSDYDFDLALKEGGA
ncbi:MAG: hypothetical protein WA810_14625, partial [Maribacter sp.]